MFEDGMDEVFVPIREFPNYSVSNGGNVRSNRTGKLLKFGYDVHGYPQVNIYNDVGVTHARVHRLVATHFLPNPSGKSCVDHVDGNPTNNHVSNLRWATQSENMRNARVNRHSRSRFKGVEELKVRVGWRAYIIRNGKRAHIGSYYDEEKAAKAYDAFAREQFGEYARLNFPNVLHSKDEVLSWTKQNERKRS